MKLDSRFETKRVQTPKTEVDYTLTHKQFTSTCSVCGMKYLMLAGQAPRETCYSAVCEGQAKRGSHV